MATAEAVGESWGPVTGALASDPLPCCAVLSSGVLVIPAEVSVAGNVVAPVPTSLGTPLNADAPCVIPVSAPAVNAPFTPIFSESFRLPPARRLPPAPATKPLTAETAAGAVMFSRLATAGPATMNNAAPIMILPTVLLANFLTARPIFLKTPFSEKNSGNPVRGFIDPLPPRLRSRAASCGLICANIVSPLRPSDAIPPCANPCGAIGAAAAGLYVKMSSTLLTPEGIGGCTIGLAPRSWSMAMLSAPKKVASNSGGSRSSRPWAMYLARMAS